MDDDSEDDEVAATGALETATEGMISSWGRFIPDLKAVQMAAATSGGTP